MCGITGIFAYRDSAPSIDPAEFNRMRDQMAAWGPDGAGSWHSEDGRVDLRIAGLRFLISPMLQRSPW